MSEYFEKTITFQMSAQSTCKVGKYVRKVPKEAKKYKIFEGENLNITYFKFRIRSLKRQL